MSYYLNFNLPHAYLLCSVKCQVVHGQFLELVCASVEQVQVVLQVDNRKLFQLHLGQSNI